jgi:hypothetical protein
MHHKSWWSGSTLCFATLLIAWSAAAGAQTGGTLPPADACSSATCTSSSLPPAASFPPISLKADKAQNIRDAARVAELASQGKRQLENDSHLMLSADSLKKVDEMQKLIKELHNRLKVDALQPTLAPLSGPLSPQLPVPKTNNQPPTP